MSIVEPTTMPETTRRTAIDTSSSISVNPPSPDRRDNPLSP